MHFAENQLAPGSIGISPLPTDHPMVLQHQRVRAFALSMGSSPGLGSTARDSTSYQPSAKRRGWQKAEC